MRQQLLDEMILAVKSRTGGDFVWPSDKAESRDENTAPIDPAVQKILDFIVQSRDQIISARDELYERSHELDWNFTEARAFYLKHKAIYYYIWLVVDVRRLMSAWPAEKIKKVAIHGKEIQIAPDPEVAEAMIDIAREIYFDANPRGKRPQRLGMSENATQE